MSITAKELAKQLGLSPSAVSIALNNKPGISTETRKRVLEAAKISNYDFSKLSEKKTSTGIIYFLIYIKDGTVVYDNPFIEQVTEGIKDACNCNEYKLIVKNLYEDGDISESLNSIIYSDCDGIIILGTEMQKPDFMYLKNLEIPIVLIDTYCDFPNIDCVMINNSQGAYNAAMYLIHQHIGQPGYLHSSYSIHAYEERKSGFFNAIKSSGLPVSKSIVHSLCPSVEGAYADMIEILEHGEPVSSCYFADNDNIAIGAMKAFKQKGYKIPSDVSIIGFDNIPLSTSVIPALSTVHIPKQILGKTAAQRLIDVIHSDEYYPVKIEISPTLIHRKSVLNNQH